MERLDYDLVTALLKNLKAMLAEIEKAADTTPPPNLVKVDGEGRGSNGPKAKLASVTKGGDHA